MIFTSKTGVEKIEELGLPVVTQIEIRDGDYDALIKEYLHAKSDYGTTGVIREGLVFFNPVKQMFAKVVREKFKEQNSRVFWGKQPKRRTPEDHVAELYATEARIRKQVHILRYVDFKAIEMKLMTALPQRVMEDIIAEEGASISRTTKVIDFPLLRSKIAPLCVPVLQTMVSEVDIC